MARACNLLALALLIVGMAGCSAFETRSGDFECSQQSDCTAPRVCEVGYCVIGNATDPVVADADPVVADADPVVADAAPMPDAKPDADDDEQ